MRLVRSFWIVSLLGFLAADLFVYGDAPEVLNLHFDAKGEPDLAWLKVDFFYNAFYIGLIPNILLILLGYAVPYLPKSLLLIANKETWLKPDNRNVFYRVSRDYIRGFAFILNLFFIAAIFGVYYLNSTNEFPLEWSFYAIGAMGIAWIFYGFGLFRKHPDDFA